MSKKDFQTPAEAATLADIDKQIAAGGDPFGDEEPLIAESIEVTAAKAKVKIDEENGTTAVAAETDPAADPAPGDKPADSEGGEVDAAAATAETDPAAAQVEEPAVVVDEPIVSETLVAPPPNIDPAKIATERKTLLTARAEELKKLMDGHMSPEEYAAKDAERQAGLDKLLRMEVRLETYFENRNNEQTAAIAALMAKSAEKGSPVDYNTDKLAPLQFDTAFQMLMADPANARRPFANVVAQAHKAVLALRGIKTPAPAAVVAPATPAATPAVARVPAKGPVTLRNVPAASVPNTTGDLASTLGKLKGLDYEAAFNKLTPAQKAALVDD